MSICAEPPLVAAGVHVPRALPVEADPLRRGQKRRLLHAVGHHLVQVERARGRGRGRRHRRARGGTCPRRSGSAAASGRSTTAEAVAVLVLGPALPAQGHLDRRPRHGDGRAQLVGGVGHELALLGERRLEPRQQIVEARPAPSSSSGLGEASRSPSAIRDPRACAAIARRAAARRARSTSLRSRQEEAVPRRQRVRRRPPAPVDGAATPRRRRGRRARAVPARGCGAPPSRLAGWRGRRSRRGATAGRPSGRRGPCPRIEDRAGGRACRRPPSPLRAASGEVRALVELSGRAARHEGLPAPAPRPCGPAGSGVDQVEGPGAGGEGEAQRGGVPEREAGPDGERHGVLAAGAART